jgi:hypothetical protein
MAGGFRELNAVQVRVSIDESGPPPMKWSDSKYGFATEEVDLTTAAKGAQERVGMLGLELQRDESFFNGFE